MNRINFSIVLHILGIFLIIESIAILLCGIAAVYYKESYSALLYSSGIIGGLGTLLFALFRKSSKEISKREGYIIVSCSWFIFALFGSLPYVFSGIFQTFADSLFESMSGFTTTGSTVITQIESIPKHLLLWRSLSQWLGGMGIVVLSLTIVPLLGIGGMQLYTAEVPGPTKEKIHPRIQDTAQRLYLLYIACTVLLALLLVGGGMNIFDSINHAFTTMSSGGFSVYSDSLTHSSPYIQYVVILFMFISGVNFILLYHAVRGKFVKVWANEEFRSYVGIILAFSILIFLLLLFHTYSGAAADIEELFRSSLFQTVSIITTTGFSTVDYLTWSPIIIMLCFTLLFFGASSGSTSGGIKIMRIVLLAKHSYLEFKRLIHPNAIIPVRFNNEVIHPKVVSNTLAFIVIYMIVFVVGVLLMSFLNYDLDTSLGAVAASISNVGTGIGKVGPSSTYTDMSSAAKYILSFLMLCGRLELFTVFILFSPAFWRK